MRLISIVILSLMLVGCSGDSQDVGEMHTCTPADSPPVSMGINGKDIIVTSAKVKGNAIVPPEKSVDRVVGWYEDSAMPNGCDDGSIVITSHINFGGVDGVGMDFSQLSMGDELSLTTADGNEHMYTVTHSMELVDKNSPDFVEKGSRTFNKVDGDEILVLVTCAGEFDPHSPLGYQSNGIIVLEPMVD